MFKDLESAQESFVRFLGQLQQNCKIGFLEWVCKEYSLVPSALESDQYLLEEETEEPGKTFLSLLPEAGGYGYVLDRSIVYVIIVSTLLAAQI